jgi:hypothetical protein
MLRSEKLDDDYNNNNNNNNNSCTINSSDNKVVGLIMAIITKTIA